MPDRAAARFWSRPGPAALAASFVAVPAVLAAIWSLRRAPPEIGCGDVAPASLEMLREHWLSPAKPLLAIGALIVLGAIVRTSALRRHDGRAGNATVAACVLVAMYVVACLAYRDLIAVLAIALVFAFVMWWASLPIVGISVALWLLTRPREGRPLAALAALGWISLVLGVGGVATWVALRVTDPILC